MKARIAIGAFGLACLTACSSKASDTPSDDMSQPGATSADNSSPAEGNRGSDRLANIDPCSLLTDDEIGMAADNSAPPAQREARHKMGVKFEVSKQVDRSGMTPVCHVSWRAVASGDEREKGMFDIAVMTASHLKSLEGSIRPHTGKRSAPIAGIGDEAFYLEHAPSARVGDLGVSIMEFSSADGGIELLKEAAGRLH